MSYILLGLVLQATWGLRTNGLGPCTASACSPRWSIDRPGSCATGDHALVHMLHKLRTDRVIHVYRGLPGWLAGGWGDPLPPELCGLRNGNPGRPASAAAGFDSSRHGPPSRASQLTPLAIPKPPEIQPPPGWQHHYNITSLIIINRRLKSADPAHYSTIGLNIWPSANCWRGLAKFWHYCTGLPEYATLL